MRIRIEPHTLERARERGVSPSQIEDVLLTGFESAAVGTRLAKLKTYDYHGTWKGRRYDQQMLKVIYVLEDDLATTVTVIAYYGNRQEAR